MRSRTRVLVPRSLANYVVICCPSASHTISYCAVRCTLLHIRTAFLRDYIALAAHFGSLLSELTELRPIVRLTIITIIPGAKLRTHDHANRSLFSPSEGAHWLHCVYYNYYRKKQHVRAPEVATANTRQEKKEQIRMFAGGLLTYFKLLMVQSKDCVE
jgi:hypothetical protein